MRLVLASGNRHKLDEIRDILPELAADLRPQSDFDLVSPPETGTTFLENALIKARHAAAATGLPVIAEDSGLEVAALDGAPGIYSARYAGEHAADSDNVNKLLLALRGVPDERRGARFCCVAVCLRGGEDSAPAHVSASWEGRIAAAPAGAGGFGYDPVFYLPECGCTAAELSAQEKNRRSHRAQAFSGLYKRCLS